MTTAEPSTRFSSTFPLVVYTRPVQAVPADWQEFDHGPGIFTIPDGCEVMVRIKNIDDQQLRTLVRELAGFTPLVYLNLSENRKVTNTGLEYLRALDHLRMLNLSSCSLTDEGLAHISALIHLEYLDLSYCNRLHDAGLKHLQSLSHLKTLNIDGCLRITKAGVARFGKRDLTILR